MPSQASPMPSTCKTAPETAKAGGKDGEPLLMTFVMPSGRHFLSACVSHDNCAHMKFNPNLPTCLELFPYAPAEAHDRAFFIPLGIVWHDGNTE